MPRKRLTAEQVKINISTSSTGFYVEIVTPHLFIRSVLVSDTENYLKLFSDPIVMKKYAQGQPLKTEEERNKLKDRIKTWVTRTKQTATFDAFNGLAIFTRFGQQEFVGHIVLGRGDKPGVSELAYLLHKKFWNQGLGTEAVSAVVNHYARYLIQKKFKLEGLPFYKIEATTRTDHWFSQKILKLVGLETDGTVNEKYGAKRYIYALQLAEEPQHQRSCYLITKALGVGLGLFAAYKAWGYATTSPDAVINDQPKL